MELLNQLECCILSQIIHNPQYIEILRVKECFVTQEYKDCLEAMINEYQMNKVFDIKAIVKKYPNLDYLAILEANEMYVGTSERLFEYYQDNLVEEFKDYQAKKLANEYSNKEITLSEFNSGLSKLKDSYTKPKIEVRDEMQIFNNATSKKKKLEFNKFSMLTTDIGTRQNVLHVIGARPAVGKTAFVLNLINDLSSEKYQVVYFSYEMGTDEIDQRLIAINGNIPIKLLDSDNFMNNDKIVAIARNVSKQLSQKNIITYHDKYKTSDVESIIREISKNTKKHIVFVIDTINYLEIDGNNRLSEYEKMTQATRFLQLLTKKYDCTCFVLAHISREGESDITKQGCLKGSGELEQSAHIVYTLEEVFYDKERNFSQLRCHVIKNRSGIRRDIDFDFEKTSQRMKVVNERN